MTLTISNEIPENIRRGLLAKAEGKNWEECAEISKISRYEMMKWRKHPDADNLISTAINYKLEEALGIISCSAPQLCKRLVDIGLSERTRPYTAVQAISESFKIIQSGVIDRENKAEMRKLFRQIEKLEGQPQAIDI